MPIRELRNFTARVMQRVKQGEVFEITERGRPIARLVPAELDRWHQLIALGLVDPPEDPGDPLEFEPLPPRPGVPLPSELLQRWRDEDS